LAEKKVYHEYIIVLFFLWQWEIQELHKERL